MRFGRERKSKQIRDIRVKRQIRFCIHTPEIMTKRRAAVFGEQSFKRPGMQPECKRTGQIEQCFSQPEWQAAGERNVRYRPAVYPVIGAPVGVADRRIRNPCQPRTDSER